jgi:hypothetical protein
MRKSSLVLLSMLGANVAFGNTAFAEPPAPIPSATREAASALVNKEIVQRLKKSDTKRSKFSRAAPPPRARRVRVIDSVARVDVHGKQFVRFAIDVHHRFAEDDEWAIDAFLGCVYVEDKKVFLSQGSDYLPASSAIDGEGDPQPDVCRSAPESDAQIAAKS